MGRRVGAAHRETLRDSGGSVQCYGEDGSLGRGASLLYEDSGGNLWAGRRPGCGDGSRSSETLSDAGTRRRNRALTEGDNGALLIATRGGIRQFVDGKSEPYPLPARSAIQALTSAPGSQWRPVDRDNGPGALACAPGKDGSVFAV
jgi:hypothetical protein